MEEEKEEELNFDLTQQNIIIPEETPSCNEVIGCSVRENITAILFVLACIAGFVAVGILITKK